MASELSGEQRFWLRLWTIVFSGLVLLAATITIGVLAAKRQMINSGFHLEKVQTNTYYDTYWTK